ncbi:LysR family transcriptional regulator [Parapusillimonas sp. SGNA-6]|nr:LysR family transcriptional regulator [Parapusillimonas sp. SGNA-6]
MKKYSLAQIEALLAISRLGTFHAAAKHINVTQPTISLRIRELEEALGAKFFEREGRSAKLSAEGVIATQYAEQVLGLFDELETRLRTGDPLQGSLRVGSSETVAIACLPQIMSILDDTYPKLRVALTVANSFVLSEQLKSGHLDIAFLSDPGIEGQVHMESLAAAPLAWIGSARKLLDTAVLHPADLAETTVLCVPPPSPLYDIVAKWCAAEGSSRPMLSTCNSLAMIAKMVASGVAMGVLPVCILQDEFQRGTVVRYQQRVAFKPLRICAAYDRASDSEGLQAVVRIARHVIQREDSFAASWG